MSYLFFIMFFLGLIFFIKKVIRKSLYFDLENNIKSENFNLYKFIFFDKLIHISKSRNYLKELFFLSLWSRVLS
jgi:hypothetical protein